MTKAKHTRISKEVLIKEARTFLAETKTSSFRYLGTYQSPVELNRVVLHSENKNGELIHQISIGSNSDLSTVNKETFVPNLSLVLTEGNITKAVEAIIQHGGANKRKQIEMNKKGKKLEVNNDIFKVSGKTFLNLTGEHIDESIYSHRGITLENYDFNTFPEMWYDLTFPIKKKGKATLERLNSIYGNLTSFEEFDYIIVPEGFVFENYALDVFFSLDQFKEMVK